MTCINSFGAQVEPSGLNPIPAHITGTMRILHTKTVSSGPSTLVPVLGLWAVVPFRFLDVLSMLQCLDPPESESLITLV